MPSCESDIVSEAITWISINLGPQVGSNDTIIGVRVVTDRVDGNVVYGRTLNIGEEDSGEGITVKVGQRLVIESVKFNISDVERYTQAYPSGYASIANTVWTWVHIPPSQGNTFFNYMLATARRLDQAHALWAHALNGLTISPDTRFIQARARIFDTLGKVESMCNALSRAVAMINDAPNKLCVKTPVPNELTNIQDALTGIRNAFEHIDERAMGQARREGQTDAMSIFDQQDLATKGVVTYAGYTLNLHTEILPTLLSARKFIYDTITEPGSVKTMNNSLVYEGVWDDNSGKIVLAPSG